MEQKNIITLITLVIIYIFNFSIYSDSASERKKIHIYVTPSSAYIDNLNQKTSVIGSSDQYLTLMFGLFDNFYLGLSYTNANKNRERYANTSPLYFRQSQLEFNRRSEYFTGEKLILKSQFFFWNNFYTSLNVGLEKGYKINENLFSTNMNNYLVIQPYQKTTIFDDRAFGSIGIGYRKEFLSNFIIGTELEFGYLGARKVNKHYTFDPGYSTSLLNRYLITKDINEDRNGSARNYHFFSIYAGIAI
ncbi:hypothetical protein EHQ68_17115 [Leptospira congkakensis]|uniref:Outer membrane protein beta-barrel domain-containing protein n=1 Tax=Leptospira congkakensis TaxID=2484932 RepID=A0A4Z1AEK7_9LEPT|nr:hypothetical protein [Leptospira congkakensis]TGL85529.1 hypothetical protein EHQ68_17115 [Leptospira congkakensis]TGL92288.1 hypothetical protein EHQ69_08405 [Leptospira congkakensis]TGM00034.1 hypothetical protein EHQ70_00360 [Leptospira congkakensis]